MPFPKYPRPASIKNQQNTKPEHQNAENAPQLTQTVEEQQQIITFDNDQAEVTQDLPMPVKIPIMPGIAHADLHNHSVISFFTETAAFYHLSDGCHLQLGRRIFIAPELETVDCLYHQA